MCTVVCFCAHLLMYVDVLQVGNLGLLFMLLFFIYAALGVELFGELGKILPFIFSEGILIPGEGVLHLY